LGDDRNAFLGEEMLHNKQYVFAQGQISLVVQQFLAQKSFPVISQPTYTSDLAPSDLWLFPTLKMSLKGTRFSAMEDIEWTATTDLQKIPNEAFGRCFQQWQDRMSKCVCVRKCPTLKMIR
jgi:hypothetical protein